MSAPDLRTRVSVVVQTHWDREWYLPHQRFVARMLRVVEAIASQLEDGSLQQFLFDGQTAAMEDLLAHAEPALAERVRALVRTGRIVLGPWYVMADEFLSSGEALWRNLELGMADAEALGNCQRVGYLPDTFGHVSQMPQILRRFGIQSAVLWRGADSAFSEFDWQAPDGSRVPTIFMSEGYYQHPFNLADWRPALEQYLEKVRGRSLGGPLLLAQGGDHLMPNPGLAQRIDAFNASQDDYVLTQASLSQYVDQAIAASEDRRQTLQGELRQNAQAFVLPDVLSTRRYLKRLNQAAEDKLLGLIEPLYAQLRVPVPHAYLEQTWRLLIQQQAHDSICGCSVDAVHDEMLTRYAILDQRLEALRERALADAGMIGLTQGTPSPFDDDSRCTLFNAQPYASEGWQEFTVFIKGEQHAGLRLQRIDGAPIDTCVIAVAAQRELRSPLDDFPDPVLGHRYTLAVRTALPALGAVACTVHPQPQAETHISLQQIENDFLCLAVVDGALQLTDKRTGMQRDAVLALLSESDAGDTYNFSPAPQGSTVLQTRYTLLHAQRQGPVQELLLAIELARPASLADGAPQVRCHGQLRLRLWDDRDLLDAHLEWTNAAADQRTRLLLPLAQLPATTGSDGAFSWDRRPVVLAQYPEQPSRREMPVAVNPSHSAVLAGEWMLCQRAMQEYEVLQHAGQAYLGLTLVRSVGWLSRRDLVTRGVGAGPDLATPGAQCLGTEVFEFRFGLQPTATPLDALQRARVLRRPPALLRGHTNAWRDPWPLAEGLVATSLRPQADTRELRAWNASTSTLDEVAPHAIASFRRPL